MRRVLSGRDDGVSESSLRRERRVVVRNERGCSLFDVVGWIVIDSAREKRERRREKERRCLSCCGSGGECNAARTR